MEFRRKVFNVILCLLPAASTLNAQTPKSSTAGQVHTAPGADSAGAYPGSIRGVVQTGAPSTLIEVFLVGNAVVTRTLLDGNCLEWEQTKEWLRQSPRVSGLYDYANYRDRALRTAMVILNDAVLLRSLTDSRGHFHFERIPPGSYLLWARSPPPKQLHWLVPINVSHRKITPVTLDGSNEGGRLTSCVR